MSLDLYHHTAIRPEVGRSRMSSMAQECAGSLQPAALRRTVALHPIASTAAPFASEALTEFLESWPMGPSLLVLASDPLEREANQFAACFDAELFPDVRAVCLDGLDAQPEIAGDLAGAETAANE